MKILDEFNLFFLWFKKRKKYSLSKKYLGINLGSEYKTIPEYVGIDGSPLIAIMRKKLIPKSIKKKIYSKTCTSNNREYKIFEEKIKSIPFIHHNLLYGIPLKDKSVENIYTSHFLEHLTEKQGKNILIESFRVLKKGGILRIVIPSIEGEIKKISETIMKFKEGDAKPIQRFLTTSERDISPKNFSLHRRLYGYWEVKEILKKIGFRNITRCKFKEGRLPFLDKIEHRDGLILEAEK